MIQAEVTDHAALAARSPLELAMYLRSQDWTRQSKSGTSAQWIKVVDGAEFEALQPLESTLRDYPARVRDILQVLAVVEGRSQLDILADISNVSMDVHTVRAFPAGNVPGTIGLDDGVQAFESLRNVVAAAAYSVRPDQARAVQPARKPAEVLKFLREVRFGPGSEGSFVLSVFTPVPPRLASGQASLFDEDLPQAMEPAEPFERQVSLKIYDAVRAAYDAANEALVGPAGLDAFTTAVRDGVSANLCEALAGLGGESGHPFELALRLAPGRPLRTRQLPPIRFRHDHLPVLVAAAQGLRERIPEEGVLIVGNVVRLHREETGSGEVSIAGVIEGEDRLRRFWVNLPQADYDQAVRAHREMLSVSVRGDLVRRATRLHLRNPTAFQVLTDLVEP
ncbi:hypothetical protein EDC02_4383 [Micromonospora sp. Llam0]|uniref:hypothetical protein n=1 Tax=Micromonospora sp. Llam0 TaxID=2485143 RepID=UPI000F4A2F28|nr:hypothetical protein [Micromonospora sp. Llam0]ROO62406.1 hypothetical protein EDC02_4383 [Micromonospora sp. Llam0]